MFEQISLIDTHPAEALELLRAGKIDVAVIFRYAETEPEPDGVRLHHLLDDPVLWDGKTSRATNRRCYLPACSNSSGFCSRSSWPGYGRARTLYSRTCCCATSSLSSPVRLEPDRALGFAAGTSCSGSWLAASVPAGVSI